MKKLKNDGFSALVLLLGLLIIGAVVGVGWYVSQRNQNDQRESNSQEQFNTTTPLKTGENQNSTQTQSNVQFPSDKEIVEAIEAQYNDGGKYVELIALYDGGKIEASIRVGVAYKETSSGYQKFLYWNGEKWIEFTGGQEPPTCKNLEKSGVAKKYWPDCYESDSTIRKLNNYPESSARIILDRSDAIRS